MSADARLEYLRTIATPNIIDVPSPFKSKKGQLKKKVNRRNKASRQLIADELKRINLILQPPEENEQQQSTATTPSSTTSSSPSTTTTTTITTEYKKLTPKVTYFNINAPPSMKPPKKYCDITGLNGPYTSPTNNIRYHNSEIYQIMVKPMVPGTDQEYLKLRGANFVLK
ncbi:hypothetical protein C6P44_000677 [Monosporozyma unispora]|nr:hypothetical protein C6P44_000677 [Kazachstania unispora]